MKYKILSWEEGEVGDVMPDPCVYAKVECTPAFFWRLLGKKKYTMTVYGQGILSCDYTWYNAETGQLIDRTTYANYDNWGAGKRLGDFLDLHVANLKELRDRRKILELINKARKK